MFIMKLLFSAATKVSLYNGKYYEHSLSNVIIPRYLKYCEQLYCLCNVEEVNEEPIQPQILYKNVEIVDSYRINTFRKLLFSEYKNNSIIEEVVRKVDACVIHMPTRIGRQIIKIAQKYSKPYLLVIVGCPWDAYWNHGLLGKIVAPMEFWRLRKVVKESKYAMYVTNSFLQARYPSKGRSIGCSDVYLNNIDDKVLSERLLRIDNNDNNLIIGTLAAVDVAYKGQAYVIKAIANLKKLGVTFDYYLAGGGDKTRLLKIAKKLGVEDNAKFLGFLNRNEVSLYLKRVDIYIQPSKQEGLPRALVEAMSYACPALGSKVAGIPELLDEKCLFKKGNVSAICNLLLSFSKEKMKSYAKRNFEMSKLYTLSILESRRDSFIKEFLDYVHLQK